MGSSEVKVISTMKELPRLCHVNCVFSHVSPEGERCDLVPCRVSLFPHPHLHTYRVPPRHVFLKIIFDSVYSSSVLLVSKVDIHTNIYLLKSINALASTRQ